MSRVFRFVRTARGRHEGGAYEERGAKDGFLQRGGWVEMTSLNAVVVVAVALAVGMAGCREGTAGQHYELKGKVVEVDRQLRRVTVAHDAIAGYMDAMTMPFVVKDD